MKRKARIAGTLSESRHKIETLAIHAGQAPEPVTGAVMTPVFLTSTYAQKGPGEHTGFEYSRTQNPTRFALEANLAALEGGAWGLAFNAGVAASTAVLSSLDAGDHVVAGDDIYGGTFRLFDKIFRRLGLTFTYVDARDVRAVAAAITARTRLCWVETPTNPLLHLADIRAVGPRLRRARRPARRRQHLHDAVLPAPARARRRPRRPLDDQVPERPLRRRRRRHHRPRSGAARRASPFSRTRWAAASRPSTASWCCAGPRRWPCAWSAIRRTRSPSPAGSNRGARSRASSTPASARTRSTRWRAARCPASAG